VNRINLHDSGPTVQSGKFVSS